MNAGNQSRIGDAMQVGVRVRPLSEQERAQNEHSCITVDSDSGTVRLQHANNAFKDSKEFHFEHVYGTEASQQSIFDDLGMPLVEAAIQGFNTCMLAYGMTGSGKTHSMTGSPSDPGVSTRS